MTPTTTTDELDGDSNVRSWVLDRIRERTDDDPESEQGVTGTLWTARERIIEDAGKFSTGVTQREAELAFDSLCDSHDVLYWHGTATLATEAYLRAVIQSEVQAENTRPLLVGKCNRLLDEIESNTDGD